MGRFPSLQASRARPTQGLSCCFLYINFQCFCPYFGQIYNSFFCAIFSNEIFCLENRKVNRKSSENENRSVYAVHNPTGRNEIDEYVKCRLIHWFVNLFCLLYVYSVHLSYLFSFLLFAVGIYLLANHFGECLAMIFMVDNLLSRD